jgi:hypothetical protein
MTVGTRADDERDYRRGERERRLLDRNPKYVR